jgi:hypothetical protein
VLHPERLAVPSEPLVGAAAIHGLLSGWRRELQADGSQDRSAASSGAKPEGTTATLRPS